MAEQQLQQLYMKMMVDLRNTGSENFCINKCVAAGPAELRKNEKLCLAKCQDRYIEAFAIVTSSIQDSNSRHTTSDDLRS